MSQLRRVHLFNCDRTYKFDTIEDLLNATKAKLSFVPAKRHNFTLGQMSEMITKIPNLEMDVAIFVVHAHESRLSINEDNAGIGYAKIYRALLKATGEKVIIVIGGDDNYRNEDEEDQVVISRWAKRKISSQFNEEFLDGRKSFIFSWNKKHRPIHEEALRHYFDPSKKGQKFEYQPKPKQGGSSKTAQSPSPRSPFHKAQSMDEQREEDRPFIRSHSVGQKGQDNLFNSSKSAKERGEGLFSRSCSVEQKGQDPLFSGAKRAEQRTEDSSFRRTYSGQKGEDTLFSSAKRADQRGEGSSSSRFNSAEREDIFWDSTTGATRGNMEPSDSDQGIRSKDTFSAGTGTTNLKDLEILGCNVSENSMQAVRKVFQDIGPRVNLSVTPSFENYPPSEVKRYLTKSLLRFCVLVVDAATVKEAYENLPRRKVDYEELLETAANEVVEKVIILVCGNYSLPSKDKEIVSKTIERIINKRGKGFVAQLNDGKLAVNPDVLVDVMSSQRNQLVNISGDLKRFPASASVPERFDSNSDPLQVDLTTNSSEHKMPTSHGLRDQSVQNPYSPVTVQPQRHPTPSNTWESVKVKSILRYGRISKQSGDVQIWCPEFVVPESINQCLFNEYKSTPETGVKIVLDNYGGVRWTVETKSNEVSGDEEIEMAPNETLMLKARVRNGQVSLEKGDLEYIDPKWEVPQYIIDRLYREYWATPDAKLHIISDEKGNLRYKVNVKGMDRLRGFGKKTWKRITR